MPKLKLNPEKIILILLCLSFFIGLWHALPMLKVVGDEMYFVGGVLRAMENHTIIPAAGDVPYGTLTYLLNYILIGIILIVIFPFFGFSLSALKLYLITSPEYMYLAPRFLSAVLAIILLVIINKILKNEFNDWRIRISLLILLFTNMLAALILRTGKMWVLSTLLVIVSIYYLYQALVLKQTSAPDQPIASKIFLSVIFAFLSFANFPLNGFTLINLPLIFFFFQDRKAIIKKTLIYAAIGLVVFLLVTLANFNGIKDQVISIFTRYHPITAELTATKATPGLTAWQSMLMFLKRTLAVYSLLIAALFIVIKDKIKNKPLFIISLSYFIVYFIVISLLATWATTFYAYIRYLFPLGFFLILIIASFNIKFHWIFYPLVGLSLIYYGFTLYFLSALTTLNQARNWVMANINQPDTVIYNQIRDLELPKNKSSYLLTDDYYCSSKCQAIINHDLNQDFKPIIIDKYTETGVELPDSQPVYYIESAVDNLPPKADLIAAFGNQVIDGGYSLDGRVGNYFDFDYFRIKNFGLDIYIYQSE